MKIVKAQGKALYSLIPVNQELTSNVLSYYAKAMKRDWYNTILYPAHVTKREWKRNINFSDNIIRQHVIAQKAE